MWALALAGAAALFTFVNQSAKAKKNEKTYEQGLKDGETSYISKQDAEKKEHDRIEKIVSKRLQDSKSSSIPNRFTRSRAESSNEGEKS